MWLDVEKEGYYVCHNNSVFDIYVNSKTVDTGEIEINTCLLVQGQKLLPQTRIIDSVEHLSNGPALFCGVPEWMEHSQPTCVWVYIVILIVFTAM